MHFDERTQQALHESGLDAEAVAAAADRVAELVDPDAERLREFFADDGPFHSDMELAHSTAETQTHPTADVELFTHGSDLRGYLSLDGWGVAVEDRRVLRTAAEDDAETSEETSRPVLVELTLGPTIHDRVRFARDGGEL